MPWRRTADPYAVWVSEVMLQQTQVGTAWDYYVRWMKRFPTVESLAAAGEPEVLAHWQGLGYYNRAKRLLQGAKQIASTQMPRSAAEWLKVPGVGRYTAGSIASICFAEASPVVDGNVERVYSRLTCSPSIGSRLNRDAWTWAETNIVTAHPSKWNQALMELGATVCRFPKPMCDQCPISRHCKAYRLGLAADFPKVGPKPPTKPTLALRTQVVYDGQRFGMRPSQHPKWWTGLWEFPTHELSTLAVAETTNIILPTVKHQVTNQKLLFYPEFVSTHGDSGLQYFENDELATLPLSAPQRKILKLARQHLGLADKG